MELPESFKKRIKGQLGDEYDSYLSSYDEKSVSGLRVNTLKLSPERFKEISPYEIKKIPWVNNGFYYDNVQPAKQPYYYAGMYYLQEPSAMTPASLIPINENDHVLDLCAAPGGKSTELAARLNGTGVLVSNDISNSRAKALLKNLEMFGVKNSLIISEAPNKLADVFDEYFDKILVDAPCSGEGMFRKSPAIIRNWEQYGVEYYNKLQREILPFAIKMLKPGGYLLYSTCTFSPEEDEGTIKFILDTYPDMCIVPALSEREGCDYSGFTCGHPEWVDGQPEIKDAVRIWPHRITGEGHFIALLHKKTNNDFETRGRNYQSKGDSKLLSDEAVTFLKGLRMDINFNNIQVRDGRVFLLPDVGVDTKGLRILRSGLLMGEIKKGRFEPSQALACALKAEEYDNCYSLKADDTDVIRYLKCETIDIKNDCHDGWILVCVDGYPLGWGKYNKGSFKNKYLPGWRWL